MNPESDDFTPLSLDELTRLAVFLAERGHTDAIYNLVARATCDALMVAGRDSEAVPS